MSVNIQYPDVKAGKKMIRVAWARSDQDMRGVAPNRKYFGTGRVPQDSRDAEVREDSAEGPQGLSS
jgi:hypothetical protein